MLARACNARLGARRAMVRPVANAADQSDTHDAPLHGSDAALVQSILRVDMVAQAAAAALFSGQASVRRSPPDVLAFRDAELAQLRRVQEIAPHHRVRPSLLSPAASAAFAALGVAAALAPRRLGAAVASGLQGALTDTYNEQLRELRERGVAEAVPGVRALLRSLRDQERAQEGSPQAPDIFALGRMGRLSPEEGVAAAVKAGTAALLAAAKRL